ncbi:MAG TPA: response regulator [Deltaproteobacteria bacterium]|nr:response regulator [Deltaproteobacteria bacterium]HPR54318.1 response regulator [Deltaproteobacteria bacterium]HXK47619.1 response regulator [Deltaproteobacteria bacterium]
MKAKILLVEDNENNRYLAKFLLEREGFTVDTATNGALAIEMARREKPDLIVMDIQMPEMDGYETARRLKSDPDLHRIPVVGVSSYAMPGDRDKAIRSGFAGYIEKPVNPETFGRDIVSFLGDRGDPS